MFATGEVDEPVGKLKRKSTGTESLPIAKQKLRHVESAEAREEVLPLREQAIRPP
jgi:hypothetical protein